MGDPCGIGPEVVVKALACPEVYTLCRPLVIGSLDALRQAVAYSKVRVACREVASPSQVRAEAGVVEVLDARNLDPRAVVPGRMSPEAGRASMEWAEAAARLAMAGEVAAVATAPVNKEAAALGGYRDMGHMELYQRISGVQEVATMLLAGTLRVVHLTTHRSLRQACDYVTKENVLAKLRLTDRSLIQWGIRRPRISVAALNPHAGEGGLLGHEEEREIAPAVAAAQREGIDARGPVPADIVFHQALEGRCDAVLAMYHDQGHIPIKVHDLWHSVSLALGLPFVRTSVDHGTAFDIAGKGVADHQSMLEAIRLAARLASGGGLVEARQR
ncbi:MAG: 4-hydroxythreonine-4-phosphate dehydrogenase PdxA [Chloroflexi bacterium]|nr:4-hydroxythreonine-4-phosphate dehydrogenase PdxA [Chloroflexota bacterium]